jgi:hypothetical protein
MTSPRAETDETDTAPEAVPLAVDVHRVARRIFLVCALVEIALFLLDYHVNYGRATDIGALRRLFSTTREDGLASWFATTQTLLVALTLWAAWAIARPQPGPRRWKRGWMALALFFTYMAIDDGAEIHERLGTTMDAWAADSSFLASFPSYSWQVLLLPLFGAFGLFLLVFLWKEVEPSSRPVLVSALACLALAVVLDFFEGLEPDHRLNLHTYLAESAGLDERTEARFGRQPYETLQHFSRSVEEVLEMLGMSLFLLMFLRHLPRMASGGVQVRWLGGDSSRKRRETRADRGKGPGRNG